MQHPLDRAVREHLAEYLSGRATLEEFGDWFVPATWDVDRMGDQELKDLTYEIILRLAEHSNGDCTETEMKDLLRPPVTTAAREPVSA